MPIELNPDKPIPDTPWECKELDRVRVNPNAFKFSRDTACTLKTKQGVIIQGP